MNASRSLLGFGLTLATVSLLAACASARPSAAADMPETAPTQAGAATPRRSASVLTSAEIAAAPGVQNAYEAVQQLRPHFLRTRGAVSPVAGGLVGGRGSRPTGRSSGQGQGNQPSGSGETAGSGGGAPAVPEDVGILVYLDRQRYGRIQTLREISVLMVDEIRFLNVGEANSEFGMGHPHGVIQVITKRGPSGK